AVSPGNGAVKDSILITVPNTPASIALNRTRDTVTSVGAALNYSAEVRNAAGGLISGAAVTWSTVSGGTIASVASNGIATALAVGSDTVVGTTTNGIADSAALVVRNLPATLSLSPSPVILTAIGASQLVTGTARNQLGGVIAGSSLEWSTSSGGVVSVPGTPTTDNGTITATGTGTATVTVNVENTTITAQVTVTVRDDPASIAFRSVDTTITAIGGSYQPGIDILNSQLATLGRQSVTWSSSNSTVASVSTAGLVTANAVGTARIRAISPVNAALGDSITVTVTDVASAATSTITASPTSI